MAVAFPSLSDLLSSLLPSEPPLPPQPPSNLVPISRPASSWYPLVAAFPGPRSKSTPAVDLGGDDIMRVAFTSLAHANSLFFKSGYYNVQVVVEDDEPEEKLVNRFRRAVLRAGVLQECRRRRFFESSQEEKKRRTREAAKKNRKRRPQPKAASSQSKKQSPNPKKRKEDMEEDDNWELPEVEIPYKNML